MVLNSANSKCSKDKIRDNYNLLSFLLPKKCSLLHGYAPVMGKFNLVLTVCNYKSSN